MDKENVSIDKYGCLKIAVLVVLLLYSSALIGLLLMGRGGESSTYISETIFARGNGSISEYSAGQNTKVEFGGTGSQYFSQEYSRDKDSWNGPKENRSVRYSLDSTGQERSSRYRFEAKAEDAQNYGFDALWLSNLGYIRAESEAAVGERVVDTSHRVVAFGEAWHRMRTKEGGVTSDLVDRMMSGEWNVSTEFHFDWEKDIPEDWLACPLPNPDTQAPAGGWKYPEVPKWEEGKVNPERG